jgi:hypothetical protein
MHLHLHNWLTSSWVPYSPTGSLLHGVPLHFHHGLTLPWVPEHFHHGLTSSWGALTLTQLLTSSWGPFTLPPLAHFFLGSQNYTTGSLLPGVPLHFHYGLISFWGFFCTLPPLIHFLRGPLTLPPLTLFYLGSPYTSATTRSLLPGVPMHFHHWLTPSWGPLTLPRRPHFSGDSFEESWKRNDC